MVLNLYNEQQKASKVMQWGYEGLRNPNPYEEQYMAEYTYTSIQEIFMHFNINTRDSSRSNKQLINYMNFIINNTKSSKNFSPINLLCSIKENKKEKYHLTHQNGS